MSEPENYDYTTPAVVDKILTPGMVLDITPEQAREAIMGLAAALKRTRERYAALEYKHHRAMSDMEIRMAKARGQKPSQPKYQDGVRYAPPPSPGQMGADGFPSRGII